MTLPDWDPKGDEEQRAFVERVHEELMLERMKEGAANAWRLDDIMFRLEAQRRGLKIKGSGRRGRKPERDASARLEQAKEDAKRLTVVFRRLWKKSNRQSGLTRARILAQIWNLSPEDEAVLSDHIAGEKRA